MIKENTGHVSSLARLVLIVFILTFIASRLIVFLIMSNTIPDFYLFIGGTHIHHLNYGIFILAVLSGYLLFVHPKGRGLKVCAVLYAMGLALTFDEFGMWLHLGGDYWQRASFDAVIVITSVLGLIAFSSPLRSWRSKHYWLSGIFFIVVVVFFFMLIRSLHLFEQKLQNHMITVEQNAPKD